MPKRVDHQERRTLIADALMRVAAEHGLEAVSLRHVAAEAGVSSGMVQHYFRTKDEMMAFALSVVREHSESRVGQAVAALGPDPSPRTLLRTMLAELLPLDEARRADGRVALAFLAYTAVRPAVAAALHGETAELLAFIAGQIRAAQARVDPDRAAVALLAVMEGLGVYLLGGHYPPETALGALDTQLDLLLGPGGPEET
ncbi:TetR family transcriptional regulator C-terminal domain-containing protein [Micromonospora sp. NPDC006766]|uniref:TetR/AcrR family transcriptional regulator n=1 Tax=Micromonospora sp. NPDC006766 TaxID=3154778 RepID=UPI0033C6E0A4